MDACYCSVSTGYVDPEYCNTLWHRVCEHFTAIAVFLSFLCLSHADGNPGGIDVISAAAVSQTVLEVTWHPPQLLGTSDPLLLRYNIFYTLENLLNNESDVIRSVIPQFPNGTVTIQLSALNKGSTYVIGVVATSVSTVQDLLPELNIMVSTYGVGRSQLLLYIPTCIHTSTKLSTCTRMSVHVHHLLTMNFLSNSPLLFVLLSL